VNGYVYDADLGGVEVWGVSSMNYSKWFWK